MKIKKFLAESLKEGKARILEELGSEAVILSSRIIKNPTTGAENYEIVAALDEQVAPKQSIPKSQNVQNKPKSEDNPSKILQNAIYGDKTNDKFIQYFETLNDKIEELSEFVKYKYSGSLGGVFSELYKILRKAEFDDEFALKITSKLHSMGKFSSLGDLIPEVRKIIVSDIELSKGIIKSVARNISIMIGPTGSGKTTSLVKMAVLTKLSYNAKVLIVSADTYKVGGSEQLQTFSSIAGIPYMAVYSPQDLKVLLNKETNYDYIFIDTVGISPNIKEHYTNLEELVKVSKSDNIFLVQSATSSTNSFKKSLRTFLKLGVNNLILTKLDEVDTIAPLINLISSIDLPLAYITNGQQIPQDMELASKSLLSKYIIPDNLIVSYE